MIHDLIRQLWNNKKPTMNTKTDKKFPCMNRTKAYICIPINWLPAGTKWSEYYCVKFQLGVYSQQFIHLNWSNMYIKRTRSHIIIENINVQRVHWLYLPSAPLWFKNVWNFKRKRAFGLLICAHKLEENLSWALAENSSGAMTEDWTCF